VRATQLFEVSTTIAVTMLAVGLVLGFGLYFAICGVLYWRDVMRERHERRR